MGFISSGTTMFDNGALVESAGNLILLSTATASSSASISFNSTYINSDYKIYKFEFINVHPQNNNVSFTFQGSTNNGSSYGVTMTSTLFRAIHDEADTVTALAYISSWDLAQSTSYQILSEGVGSLTDENTSGHLYIFNPTDSTYVKHWIGCLNSYNSENRSDIFYTAGYFNTTSPVNAFDFKISSGNIDAGQIKLYGIKD